ncbi:MAG: ABC transporter permease [Gemmatimonadetes bacterium]|jgi:ABC-type transport system involved in multi-copper enzyme maturation permease subunit|nr:ABC transporter permease [Gemmatimonadota bacterium]MBT7913834.1 ABC transporter permease [Candidatus Bathyarchaeota archaeon]
MWILIRKEILAYLLTLRLSAALIFTITLVVMTTFIGSLDYSQRMKSYYKEAKQISENLDNATTYRQVYPNIAVRPKPLSIFGRGVDRSIGSMLYISTSYIPTSPSWHGGTNDSHLMKILIPIDFTMVVTLLLSFLAVALGFDNICGERERGTLKQILTNGISRNHIVLAKLLGGILTLTIPLTIGLVFALLILMANPDISFSPNDWVRLGIFYILSCLFLSQIFSWSFMVSCFTRNSSTSLIICLFTWLIGSVVYINVLPSYSRHAVEEEPVQLFRNRNDDNWAAYERQMEEWEKKNPSPGEAYLKGIQHGGYLRYAHPKGYEWLQKRNAYSIERLMEFAEKRYKALWAHQVAFAHQAFLVDRWSILSPYTNYRTLTYQLARTTLDDKFYLVKLGHRYRQTFIDYLRGRNAFSSRRWFSDDPEDQEPMILHPGEVTPKMLTADAPFMKERMVWVQDQEKKAERDPRRKLDLSGLPRFDITSERSLAQSLIVMTSGLIVLVLTLGLSILISMYRFQKYDPS